MQQLSIPQTLTMHLKLMSSISLLALLFLGLTEAVPNPSIRRQSNGVSITDFCFDFQLIDSTFRATCVRADAVPVPTSKDLNLCLVNNHGVLNFDSRCGWHRCTFLKNILY
jgi:hypothetical protein